MKTTAITLIRTVTYKRVFEIPQGVNVTNELLEKVQRALNIQYPAHMMKEVAEEAEFLVEASTSATTNVRLRLDGERVFIVEGESERELEFLEG